MWHCERLPCKRTAVHGYRQIATHANIKNNNNKNHDTSNKKTQAPQAHSPQAKYTENRTRQRQTNNQKSEGARRAARTWDVSTLIASAKVKPSSRMLLTATKKSPFSMRPPASAVPLLPSDFFGNDFTASCSHAGGVKIFWRWGYLHIAVTRCLDDTKKHTVCIEMSAT